MQPYRDVLSNRRRSVGIMKSILFLTGGPYFWPHQKTMTRKYEMLSQRACGFILSFVGEKESRRAKIGEFQLIGFYLSDAAYSFVLVRVLARIVFTLSVGTYLHYFKKRIDAIVTWDPFFTGALGYVLSKLTGAKLIVEVNGDYADRSSWGLQNNDLITYLKFLYVKRVMPFILNHAHAVKLLYPTQVGMLHGITRRNHYRCFHDLVPISLYRRGVGTAPYLLFMGMPWHRKGVDILIKAFNEISHDFPEWTLKIVGHLPEREQFKDLYEHNKQIQFIKAVMPEKVPVIMAECAVFVLPSRSEGMPRVLIEAMACGKPIIASRICGIPYYLKHKETALLFDSEDVQALAQAMRGVMSDKGLADELGRKAYYEARTLLSEDAHVDHFMRMIEEVTSGNADKCQLVSL